MKILKNKIETIKENLSLKERLTKIILLITITLFISTIIGIQAIQKSNNQLLYASLEGNLLTSSQTIGEKINQIQALSNTISSNPYIKKSLIALRENPNKIQRQNTNSTITSSIQDYHRRFPYINYITVVTPYTTSTSFRPRQDTIPAKITKDLLKQSYNTLGDPVYVTDYAQTEGIFLIRSFTAVQKLQYINLGTAIINIDIKKLIEQITNTILPNTKIQYILYEGDKAFYSTDPDDINEDIGKKLKPDKYKILRLNNEKYFALKGKIYQTNWTYVCLIPYCKISNTITTTHVLTILALIVITYLSTKIATKYIQAISDDFSSLIEKMKKFAHNQEQIPENNIDYTKRKDEAAVLHNQFDQMAKEIKDLINENYLNNLLIKDAQLKLLQSQINPHFLYNALESVNWRAKLIKADEISIIVQSLAKLLRASLNNPENTTTIEKELEIVRNYINIQKIRYDEERLIYKEDIDKDTLNDLIPPMSIQPIIDNAINYGLETNIEPCTIEVSTKKEGNKTIIQITNTGSQFPEDLLENLQEDKIKPKGLGIGLLNIQKRLQLIISPNSTLKLENKEYETAIAQIHLIYNEKAGEVDDKIIDSR